MKVNTEQSAEKEKSKEVIKSEAQAKNAILQFLGELKVTKIVYVDDRCSIEELREAFIGKMKSLYPEKPEVLDFVNWNSPRPVFEREIANLWDGSNEEDKRQVFLKVLRFENNQEELENSVAPLKLKEHLQEKIDLLSPSEWIEKKDNICASLNAESKILFLFDIEFEHAPLADGRNGIDLAVRLLGTEEIKDFIYCGIFSHLFSLSEEYDKRTEICRTRALEKDKFYTISKKRFQDDSYLPGLAEGIRNTLLINEVEILKKETSEIIISAFSSSLAEIEELTPESFNHIIQRSSNKEGVWEMATLFRLNSIITSDRALRTLLPTSRRAVINRSLEKIRIVEKIKTGGETPFDKTAIQHLRKKELYVEKDVLNQLHFPLANGNIFKIEKKEYILLAQPCNLAMRSGGNRSRNYDIGFFLEIEKISIEDFKKMGKVQYGVLGILETPGVEEGFLRAIKFHSFETISLAPLDLTVFNSDGIAKLNLKEPENDSSIIQDSWKKRYKKIHKEFSEYSDGIKIYRSLKSSKKESLKEGAYIGKMFRGYNINNDSALDKSKKNLVFNISRVGYYKAPYSSDLLQQFMQYLSRNAFAHNFSN